ncbi:MAG: tRNA uridine-5-carboxymethylaminomethyl(34) synthesis GTPase MnmE [Oscillospiraceae bacterium]|jgi:tRNA modification GTPase|nr:tRNA uridine-5-carboxymethylaminomethyl(34) synthesis GTPase MnmE [Oscillospiraceae bacterium]
MHNNTYSARSTNASSSPSPSSLPPATAEEATIAAVSTPSGVGGIGVVRVSGSCAYETVSKIFKPADGGDISAAKGYTAKYGAVIAPSAQSGSAEEKIDECIALFFRSPKSYTGEDVIELQCHGGSAVISRVLRAVLSAGAALAEAGEFTKRAFLNGRISLIQAEAVMGIISAKGEAELRDSLAAYEGRTSSKIFDVIENLTKTGASLAAWADFPEDDLPVVDCEELAEDLYRIESKLREILSSSEQGLRLRQGVRTVIAGRPNVGKSSLMNFLAGFERCIVTDIPGTTRDVVEEEISLGDLLLRVSDTAGIRESDDPIESIGVKEARRKIEQAQLILAVFDSSEELTDYDRELIESIINRDCVAVINKSDKQQNIDAEYIRSRIIHAVNISAAEKSGFEQLRETIKRALGYSSTERTDGAGQAALGAGEGGDGGGGVLLANERQLSAARNALVEVSRAREELLAGVTLDAVTVTVEKAAEYLLELTGERVTDKLLAEVFSRFCIGK